MSISFVAIAVGGSESNYMYLFYKDDAAFCVDPCNPDVLMKSLGIEFTKQVYTKEEIISMNENRKRRTLAFVFTTHRHLDHSYGNLEIKIQSPETLQVSGFEETLCKCGDKFYSCGVEIECICTPCHTKDSFCYYINGEYLITGDTLLFLACGKFFEGTGADMIEAIEKIKSRVSEKAILLYGHDYNKQDTQFAEQFFPIPEEIKKKRFLTLKDEIEYNPFFNLRKVGMEGTDEEIMNKLREKKNNFNAAK